MDWYKTVANEVIYEHILVIFSAINKNNIIHFQCVLKLSVIIH